MIHAAQHGQKITRLVDEHTGRVLYGPALPHHRRTHPAAPHRDADINTLYVIVIVTADDRAWLVCTLATEHLHGRCLAGADTSAVTVASLQPYCGFNAATSRQQSVYAGSAPKLQWTS